MFPAVNTISALENANAGYAAPNGVRHCLAREFYGYVFEEIRDEHRTQRTA